MVTWQEFKALVDSKIKEEGVNEWDVKIQYIDISYTSRDVDIWINEEGDLCVS